MSQYDAPWIEHEPNAELHTSLGQDWNQIGIWRGLVFQDGPSCALGISEIMYRGDMARYALLGYVADPTVPAGRPSSEALASAHGLLELYGYVHENLISEATMVGDFVAQDIRPGRVTKWVQQQLRIPPNKGGPGWYQALTPMPFDWIRTNAHLPPAVALQNAEPTRVHKALIHWERRIYRDIRSYALGIGVMHLAGLTPQAAVRQGLPDHLDSLQEHLPRGRDIDLNIFSTLMEALRTAREDDSCTGPDRTVAERISHLLGIFDDWERRTQSFRAELQAPTSRLSDTTPATAQNPASDAMTPRAEDSLTPSAIQEQQLEVFRREWSPVHPYKEPIHRAVSRLLVRGDGKQLPGQLDRPEARLAVEVLWRCAQLLEIAPPGEDGSDNLTNVETYIIDQLAAEQARIDAYQRATRSTRRPPFPTLHKIIGTLVQAEGPLRDLLETSFMHEHRLGNLHRLQGLLRRTLTAGTTS